MTMPRRAAVAGLVVALAFAGALAGCYRTHYVNLQPPGTDSPNAAVTKLGVSSWQHFFIWGWVPSERVVDAAKICGPTDQVRELRTQQTFLEGLVAELASYYVNIYSPYDAEVFCAPLAPPQ